MSKRCFALVATLATIAAITTLVAPSADSAPAVRSSELKGTLTIADWELLENGHGPQIKELFTAYQKNHPGVHLKFEAVSYDSYVPTIEAQIGAHGGPDLMVLVDSDFYNLLRAHVLAPVTGLPAADVDALRPQNSQAMFGGQRYGLIWETVIYDLIYNKSLFGRAGITEPPKTFSDFLSDCQAIKTKTGAWGYAARNTLNEEQAWYEDFTGSWIDGYGGNWTNADGKFTINSPQNIAAVSAFATVYKSGCMDTGEIAAVFRAKYEHGQVGMLMDNADAAFTYTFDNPVVTNQNQGVASLPFPTKYSGDQQLFFSINKYSKNAALADDFLAWLYSPGTQRLVVAATAPQTSGSTTPLPSEFVATHLWVVPYEHQVDNGVSLLVQKRPWLTLKLVSILMPYIERVLQGQLSAAQGLGQAQSAAISQLGN
jgi:multiple sugar transport system substrate-binding protein